MIKMKEQSLNDQSFITTLACLDVLKLLTIKDKQYFKKVIFLKKEILISVKKIFLQSICLTCVFYYCKLSYLSLSDGLIFSSACDCQVQTTPNGDKVQNVLQMALPGGTVTQASILAAQPLPGKIQISPALPKVHNSPCIVALCTFVFKICILLCFHCDHLVFPLWFEHLCTRVRKEMFCQTCVLLQNGEHF